jgi:peptide/nickel transport system ATP-binding protein
VSVVTVKDLSVSYGGKPAVRGLSFTVGPGESYGLVGESGSGKSTAALALTRYLPRDASLSAAELTVDGVAVRDLSPAELRSFRSNALAVVYQEPGLALDPTMRAGEQISEVFRLHGDSRARARERTADALRRVRLDPALATRFPHELSGGQQQRVIIAMALASEPRLLILDEPTTGLDAQVEAEIMALIDGLRDELGFASVLISHNLPLVAAHCQRIGVLREGELVEEGAAADVLLAPRHPYTQSLIAALPRIDTPRGTSPASDPLVTVEHVSKSYQRRPVLQDVSFDIGRGEVVGLVGGSGSGKTTLGLAIAGLVSYEGERRPERRPARQAAIPAFRWPEAAGRDRPRLRRSRAASDLRRAHLSARRVHPGADTRPADGHAAANRGVLPVHLARPGRRPADLRPRRCAPRRRTG